MQLGERARFLLDFLDLPNATGVDDARFEYFQLALWSDDGLFRIEDKSRQIAWSWALAADFMTDAILNGRDGIFVSHQPRRGKGKNTVREGASTKICGLVVCPNWYAIASSIWSYPTAHASPAYPASQPAVVPAPTWALMSSPMRNTTGLSIPGHCRSLARAGHGSASGQARFGASGVFWEIYTQSLRPYPGYRRRITPWWHVFQFCTNVREAVKLAPAMPTARRVELFGNDRIQAIYANMPLEDFQQEYEAEFVDETTAWITWDEIKAAQDDGLLCFLAEARESLSQEITDAVDGLAAAVQAGQVEQVFAAGMDIGRTRNTTELFLVGMSTTGQHPLRLAITLDNITFEDQLSALYYVLKRLPVAIVLIDQNGIGRNLAETASAAFPVRVAGVDFTNATKTLWATDAKMLIQNRKTPLPVDREIAYQIHSIKKLVTASRNLVFDTERNEKHHADKFWAWALALHGAYQRPPAGGEMVVVHDEALEISPF
jgi:hypothetical protein